MRKWIFSLLIVFAVGGTTGALQYHRVCEGFLPPNSLRVPVPRAISILDGVGGDPVATGISEDEFNTLLDRLEKLYQPEFRALGGTLYIERHWQDPTVNAYAFRSGGTWGISMYGGFARFPGVTVDGFAAVACHEIGHHLGGAPKYRRDWASVEGQADYYATTKCLKRLFAADDNGKILAAQTPDPFGVAECATAHGGRQDQEICVRATQAALSLRGVLKSLENFNGDYLLNAPDPARVTKTYEGHPAGQCRIDTYFQGALCRESAYSPASDTDPAVGYCADSRTYAEGLRPACWYAAL